MEGGSGGILGEGQQHKALNAKLEVVSSYHLVVDAVLLDDWDFGKNVIMS